jgi:hypothetical protein
MRCGWLAMVLLGCTAKREAPPAGGPPEDPCVGGADELFVIRTLGFVRPEDAEVSSGDPAVCDGFDLDGLETALGASDGCGIADFVGPDGTPGIDNAFAYLLPALELTEAAAVESLIQAAIENGSLLLTMELGGVSDPLDDACVDLTLGRALGPPLIGTDGLLLAGQTFAPDPDRPSLTVEGMALEGGVLEAPIDLTLPVTVFDVDLDFELLDGWMRVERGEDGILRGLFAGGVEIAYMLQVAQEENVDPALHGVLAALLGTWSDLAPDESGLCTQISITFSFEAVPAFWYP